MQVQLVALQRATQGIFQLQRTHRLRLHLRGEEAEGVAAVALGPVHGRVGRLGEGLEVGAVLREQGDAHRRRHGQLVVADLVGDAGGFLQLACHARGAVGVRPGQ